MEAQTNASMVGTVIGGRYRLSKLLGEGGMGAVYAAEHINITKTVAVKLLHPEISSNPEAVARFKQEAQSASSIGHPNIIGIDDFFTMEDGRVCLIMEFLKGESLADRMQVPGGLALDSAIDLMLQVCAGLAAAHEKGIIHRDMKPENVFIASPHGKEVVKILDFGIAKVTGNQDNSLTKTGTVFGTPHYMSPEQALGHKVDARADIYSVGVMLFEIFTGQVPFQSESFMGVLSQHITKPTPAPSSMTPGRPVPPMMEDIILTAMAKEVDKRFASMNALAGALAAFRDALRSAQPPKAVTGRVAAADVAARAGYGAPQPAPPAVAPTMAAVPGTPGATQGPGPVARLPTDEPAIPKTMMATGPQMAAHGGQPPAQPSFTPSVPVVPTPASQLNMGPVPVVPSPTAQSAPKKQKKSKTGLIIGLIVAVLLVGGGAVAAVVFWDDIAGTKDPGKGTAVAGTGTGTTQGTGSGTGQPIAANTGADAAPKAAATPDAGAASGTAASAGSGSGTGTGSGTGSGSGSGEKPVVVAKKDPDPVKKDPVKPTKKDPDPVKPIKKDPVKPIKKDPVKPIVKKDPVKPKPPQGCTVRLNSRPTRARLISGGTGFTPKSFKLDPGETLTVRLAKGGWREKSVTLSCARKNVTVHLRKGFNLDVGGGNPGIPGGGL